MQNGPVRTENVTLIERWQKVPKASDDKANLNFLSLKSCRFGICLLLMFGLFSSTSMRTNLSIGVVCMVNTTAFEIPENLTSDIINRDTRCHKIIKEGGFDHGYHGTFLWSSSEVSLLLSATWYGSMISLWWSGYFADRFGPKLIFFIGVADCVVVTLLTPLFANIGFYLLFGARFVMGIGDGMIFPALTSMVARWIPKNEKGISAALTTSGNQLAGIFALLISPYFCGKDLLGGWPLIFYFFGSIGLIWVIFWIFLTSDNPKSNRFISSKELTYLEKELHNQNSDQVYHKTIPWLRILVSIPVLVNFLAQFSYNFSLALLQFYLPIYMKQILHIELSKNGLYSMLPFLSQLIAKNILGILSDWLLKKGYLKHTTSCKLFQGICNFGSAMTYITLGFFVDCTSRNLAVLAFVFHGAFFSAGVCGFFTSQLSLAPQYTGILFSIMRLAATLGSMISVSIVGFLNKHGTNEEWMRIWVIAAVFNALVGTIYILFGSAEIQPWADESEIKARNNDIELIENK